MMQVQKGQVKYKDRSDIICTYGINDAGKQYYFLDGEKLSNGNWVASTALVEAIDPLVVASNIGVISGEGEVVVPFENKAIKPISDKAILVEKAVPSTQSVIDAVNMRKEPLAATKLVTTPATIKDRMNAKMGNGGRFIFNDQFSEASVFDLDGNNLLNDEYYSFIGLNNDTLYMSKNVVDSDIVEYGFVANEDKKSSTEELLDVKEVKVAPEEIDKAMQSGEQSSEQSSESEKSASQSKSVLPSESFHPVDLQTIGIKDDFREDALDGEKPSDNKILANRLSDKDPFNSDKISKKTEKETRISLFDGLKFAEQVEDNDSNEFDTINGGNDTIIEDTAVALSKLIKKNKEQRERIVSYEDKIKDLISFKRQAFSENQRLIKENEILKKQVTKLESELAANNEKLEKLSVQVAGKDDLAKLLVDAQSLLDE